MSSGSYDRKDRLYQQAKAEGYRSRAAYKLQELDKKYSFLKRGYTVLDLGCFPGGWLQVAAEKVGSGGRVVGVDLREVEPFPVHAKGCRPQVVVGDLTEVGVQDRLLELAEGPVDLILSDMSPQLTGIRFADVARSAELVELAFAVTEKMLKKGGNFVAKIFPGPEADEIFKRMQPTFEKLSRHCLKSSRTTSNEFYVVGRGFRGEKKKD